MNLIFIIGEMKPCQKSPSSHIVIELIVVLVGSHILLFLKVLDSRDDLINFQWKSRQPKHLGEKVVVL